MKLDAMPGEIRAWGLVGWGGSGLRRALRWRRFSAPVRDAVGRMLAVQTRHARRRRRLRQVRAAVRRLLAGGRP